MQIEKINRKIKEYEDVGIFRMIIRETTSAKGEAINELIDKVNEIIEHINESKKPKENDL